METMQKIIDHCKVQRPILDILSKFLFFSNNKVAQTSINRRALKDRSVIFKDDHAKYHRLFDGISANDFQSIYKFTIVRNPWSKVVSAYFYLKGKHEKSNILKGMSFDYFVQHVLLKEGTGFDPHFEHQHPKAFFDGKCFLDFVGKIENLKSDWEEISQHIGAPKSLPHVNKSQHESYQTYYVPATIDIVRKIYQIDIDVFQYSFGE